MLLTKVHDHLHRFVAACVLCRPRFLHLALFPLASHSVELLLASFTAAAQSACLADASRMAFLWLCDLLGRTFHGCPEPLDLRQCPVVPCADRSGLALLVSQRAQTLFQSCDKGSRHLFALAIMDSTSLMASPMFSGHSWSSTFSLSFACSSIALWLSSALVRSSAQCLHLSRSMKSTVLHVGQLHCSFVVLRVRAVDHPSHFSSEVAPELAELRMLSWRVEYHLEAPHFPQECCGSTPLWHRTINPHCSHDHDMSNLPRNKRVWQKPERRDHSLSLSLSLCHSLSLPRSLALSHSRSILLLHRQ